MAKQSKPSKKSTSSKPSKPSKPAKASKPQAAKPAASKPAPRKDFGKPIDSFFGKQPAPLREILVALRKLVEAAAPDATSSIKWGMPVYQIDGKMYAALGAHKAHVNLILAGPPGAFKDPDGQLTGGAKTGRHCKLTSIDQLKPATVKSWLETAAHLARSK